VALALLVLGTVTNMIGRRLLKVMVAASIICEIVGSVGLGTALLFYRVNPVHTLFDGFGTQGGGSWLGGPFLIAMAYVGFSFVGFEAAGSIAEEVERPERNVPKAIILSLLCVGLVVMYTSAALLLATPNLAQVVAGGSGDPVTATLTAHFGNAIVKPLLIMFVIGFVSSFLAVQGRGVQGGVRLGARRGAARCPAARQAHRPGERLPVNAIGLVALVAAVVLLLAGSQIYTVLVNMATVGFQIAFAVPVVGAALNRLRGDWVPGPFNLGRWGAPVTYIASLWLVFETVNIVWPRPAQGVPWYVTWGMLLMTALLAAAGLVVFAVVRDRIAAPLAVRLAEQRGERTSGGLSFGRLGLRAARLPARRAARFTSHRKPRHDPVRGGGHRGGERDRGSRRGAAHVGGLAGRRGWTATRPTPRWPGPSTWPTRRPLGAAISTVEAELGPVEALVTAAGHYEMVPFDDITAAGWHRMLRVHVGGLVGAARAVLPGMLARRRGSIVGDHLGAGHRRRWRRRALRGRQGRGESAWCAAWPPRSPGRGSGETRWHRGRPTPRCSPPTRRGARRTTWPRCRPGGWPGRTRSPRRCRTCLPRAPS